MIAVKFCFSAFRGGFDEEGYADIQFVEVVEGVVRKSGAEIFGEYEASSGLAQTENRVRLLKIDHS